MRTILVIVACVFLTSCEWDARRENMSLASENEDLRLQLHLSTAYIEDITEIIDQVQRNLQHIEDREGIIGQISLRPEGGATRAINVRNQLMKSISDIDAYILDNRRKMLLLAQRIQESQVRIGSLEQLVANLSSAVREKEKDVAVLKKQVSALEANVADLQGQIVVKDQEIQTNEQWIELQAQAIQDREVTIREQELAASTAYYVVDSRDELKRKGLIFEKRSGFLGLGRDTKVGTIAESEFRPVPKSESKISFDSQVRDIEIISAHKERPDLYRFERSSEGALLNIMDPHGFWALSEYLIIVASD